MEATVAHMGGAAVPVPASRESPAENAGPRACLYYLRNLFLELNDSDLSAPPKEVLNGHQGRWDTQRLTKCQGACAWAVCRSVRATDLFNGHATMSVGPDL